MTDPGEAVRVKQERGQDATAGAQEVVAVAGDQEAGRQGQDCIAIQRRCLLAVGLDELA